MTKWLPQNSIYSQYVINDSVKHDKLDVELLLVESFKSSLNVLFQFFLPAWHIVFFDEVGEQYRSLESLLIVHWWEPSSCDLIDGLVAPIFLFLVYQSIFEETKTLMDEKSDEILNILDSR